MPATQKVRRLMCAVCNGSAKAKPGQKLPSKAVACEQCTAHIKKSIREELERETPTKRFLMKFASHLSTQLPTAIVQQAMKKARGHAGGTGKITKIDISKSQPDSGDVHVDDLLNKNNEDIIEPICKFESPDIPDVTE